MKEYSFKEFYHKSMLKAIKNFVEILKVDKNAIIDIHQYFSTLSPAELEDLLEENGWERILFDDLQIVMTNNNYDFNVVIYYSGYYGDLRLGRRKRVE